MDYFCFEEDNLNFKQFVESKLLQIRKKIKDLNNINASNKANLKLSGGSISHINQKNDNNKKQIKKYKISNFNFEYFKKHILKQIKILKIKNIQDDISLILEFYENCNIEEKINKGFKINISSSKDEISYHEWCSLIDKNNYSNSNFYFTNTITSNNDFTFITGEILVLFKGDIRIKINFNEDFSSKNNKFEYKINNDTIKNYYILYLSENKDKIQILRFEINKENFYFIENFEIQRNKEDIHINSFGNKSEKKILVGEIKEYNEDWYKKENEEYIKTTDKTSSLCRDAYKTNIHLDLKSKKVQKTENHLEKKDLYYFEKRGDTQEILNENSHSKGSNYFQNNQRKYNEEWRKDDNEMKFVKYEENAVEKWNESSGKILFLLGYKLEKNEKVHEFLDKHVENLLNGDNYTIKKGRLYFIYKDSLNMMEMNGTA